MLEVFSLNGQMVFSVDNQIETTFINFEDLQLNKGVYLIKVGNQTKKVIYQ